MCSCDAVLESSTSPATVVSRTLALLQTITLADFDEKGDVGFWVVGWLGLEYKVIGSGARRLP